MGAAKLQLAQAQKPRDADCEDCAREKQGRKRDEEKYTGLLQQAQESVTDLKANLAAAQKSRADLVRENHAFAKMRRERSQKAAARFSEANLVKFAEITGASLSDLQGLATAVTARAPEGCNDEELTKIVLELAPKHNIDARSVKLVFKHLAGGDDAQATADEPSKVEDVRFSESNLAKFAAATGANLADIKGLVAAV